MKAMFSTLLIPALLLLCPACKADISTPDPGQNEEIRQPEKTATCMVKYEKGSTEENFYIAVQDEYVDYTWYVFRLRHYVNHEALTYMDLWRINWCYQGRWDAETRQMSNVLDRILTDGESESVFKDYGENLNVAGQEYHDTYDFTGGFHGDERIDLEDGCGVVFYIDGKAMTEEDMSGSFDWRDCNVFSYEQVSTMHKTALKINDQAVESDHHIVAGHTKKTTFSDSGYTTENTLVMRDAIDFYWYFGICCVGTSIAEMGCNEDMVPVTFDRAGGNKLDGIGKCEYTAWSTTKNLEVHVKANLTSAPEGVQDSAAKMHIWDTGNYAKYYRRYPATGAYRTTPSETFTSRMSVKFTTR